MIDETYFNGKRELLFSQWQEKVRSLGVVKVKEKEIVSTVSVALPEEEIEGVAKSVGREYLVPFSCDAKKIEEVAGAYVKYEVPGNFEREHEKLEITRQIVSLDYNVVCGVTDSLLGGDYNFGFGNFPAGGFVPASPYADSSSGQMKLIVDFALALDDMATRKKEGKYRILVIGCGSPGGVRSGVAYSIVPFVCDATVDMFDPFEVTRNYEVQGTYLVNYNVYGEKFVYGITAAKVKYDLIIDDSWEKKRPRNDRDVEDWVSRARCFSIKQFPWERGRKGNVYCQRFYTDGLEERRVSRDPKLHSKADHPRLGRCVACKELRFRLRNRYSDEYYNEIMNLHVKNCMTGAREYIEVITQFSSWVRVEPFVIDYSNYCSLNYDYVDGTKMVSAGVRGADKLRFIFTSVKCVPERIQVNAYQILVVDAKEDVYLVNKVISERVYNKVDVERREGSVNLAHSHKENGTKKRRDKKIVDDKDWTTGVGYHGKRRLKKDKRQ